jgi:ribonuclease-3
MKDLDELFAKWGIHCRDRSLYELAFTHSSVNGMAGTKHQDYERLEFLGDSVIGMVVSDLCFTLHPEMQQGGLSVLKAQFIRTDSESGYALRLGLDEYIRVGASFKGDVSKAKKVLEDVFEAFIGALYIDQGREFALTFLSDLLRQDIAMAEVLEEENPKSELQEAMQADHKESVTYEILAEEGPSHDKTFTAAVYFEGQELGRGQGHSKKEAESAAARTALGKLASGASFGESQGERK